MRRQLSGLQAKHYVLRFELAADGLERALRLLGCQICPDGTGMAYVVAKDELLIGGPASCQEQAMWSATKELELRCLRPPK